MSGAATVETGWRKPGAGMRSGGGALTVAVTVVCILMALVAVRTFAAGTMSGAFSSDFPWLWRTGQHILDTGRLPATDIFSWTAAGHPWVLYQWLFEAAIAAGERIIGIGGLILVFHVMAVGIYVAAPVLGAVPRRVALPWTVVASGAALAIASINLSLRPMIVTSALLLLQYVLVQRWRRGGCSLRHVALWLIPAYALWSNTHTGIVLGPMTLVAMAAGDLLERTGLFRFEPADPAIEGRPQSLAGYAVLLAAGLLASLANPYGWGIYTYLAALSADGRLNAEIAELGSPDFHLEQLTWFLGLVGVLLYLLTKRRRTLAAGDLLLLIGFTVATLYAQRFLVWAALYYALVLPRALHHAWGDRVARLAGNRTAHWLVAGLSVALPVVLTVPEAATTPLGRVCQPMLPAIDAYAAARRPSDRLLNDPLIGSCAIGTDPSLRVFIDTRFDMYGGDHAGKTLEMLRLQPGWRDSLATWKIDAVLIRHAWPLAQALALDPRFRVVYTDDEAAVYQSVAPGAASGN